MGILGWIVFGLIIGIIAKLLMPGRDPGGFIVTIIIGIVGSVIGGYIGEWLGMYQTTNGIPAGGWVMSIIGAIILLVIYRLLFRRSSVV
ncbi:MAG TPA: GlsB/YeaQ/YmgE family stress response membrane protein [Blastocatellia bacterium]|nr:GlsB/YeaQ/YmgE family stress response membrane protein [Blastocatellia bacterium]